MVWNVCVIVASIAPLIFVSTSSNVINETRGYVGWGGCRMGCWGVVFNAGHPHQLHPHCSWFILVSYFCPSFGLHCPWQMLSDILEDAWSGTIASVRDLDWCRSLCHCPAIQRFQGYDGGDDGVCNVDVDDHLYSAILIFWMLSRFGACANSLQCWLFCPRAICLILFPTLTLLLGVELRLQTQKFKVIWFLHKTKTSYDDDASIYLISIISNKYWLLCTRNLNGN